MATNIAHKNEEILNGPPMKTLLSFAVPIILSYSFQQLYNIVDAWAVGKFAPPGSLALAGMTAAAPVIEILNCLLTGATVGIGVLVGLYCGAGKQKELKIAHSTALLGGGGLTIVLGALGLIFSRKILSVQGNETGVIDESMRYLTVLFLGLIFTYLYNYYASVLRSSGNSRTPFIVLLTSSCLHAALDLVIALFTDWGVRGIAFSTIFCQLFSTLWLMLHTHRKEPFLALKHGELRFDLSTAGLLLSYAWASAFQAAVVSIGRLLVQGSLTILGKETVTGYNLSMRIEQFVYCLPQGIASSMVVCVAQNRGNKNPGRMHTFYFCSVLWALISAVLVAILCIGFAPKLIGIFTDDILTIEAGATYTHTMGFIYILSFLGENIQSFFRGLGRLRLTMIASGSQVILRVILSRILVPRLGVFGICLSVITGWFLLVTIEGGYSLICARRLKREAATLDSP